MTLTEWLALIGVGLNALIAVIGFVWGLAGVRGTLKDEIETHKTDVDARVEVLREDFTESFNGMRQKIADVELFGAHNYVKLPVFEQMMQTFNSTIEAAFDRVENRMGRIETKLDTMHSGRHFDGRGHG